MLDLLRIEWLKQRHQRLNMVVYGVVTLYLALIFYYVHEAQGLFDSFQYVYKFSLSYLNFLILPLYCVSYTIQAFGVEYRYNTLNQLKLARADMLKIFWAKMIYVELRSLSIMLFTYIAVSLFSLFTRFSSTVNLTLLWRFFYLCLASGILIPLAVFPLVALLIVKSKGKEILGNLVGVLYVLASFFLAKTTPNVSPITSANSLVWIANVEGVVVPEPAVVSGVIVLLYFTILSYFTLHYWLRKVG